MSANGALHIYSTEETGSAHGEDTFIVEDELREVEPSEQANCFAYFDRIASEIDDGFPLFDAVWPHVVLPVRDFGSLLSLVFIYRRLEQRIDSVGYESVVCHRLEDSHRAVVEDVCEGSDILIDSAPRQRESIRSLLSVDLFLFFADQLISLMLGKLYYGGSGSEITVFPFPNRYESTRPVIERLSTKSSVVVSPLTLSWFWKSATDFPGANHIRPINTYASARSLWRQCRLLLSLARQSYRSEWDVERSLHGRLREDLDIDAPRSVHYACTVAICQNVRSILTYHLFVNVLEEEGCSSVLVGGMTPRDRFALAAAESLDRDMYYLPHTIVCGNEVLPSQRDATQFLEGQYAVDYLKRSRSEADLPELVPAGRPYLDALELKESTNCIGGDNYTVLVATQPFDDGIREQFVSDVLSALEHLPAKHEAIIKVHPSEDEQFYESLLDELQIEGVSVASGNIEPYLDDSDITITISSNVGLEAILKGGCTIAYNAWTSRISEFPYIEVGPVPQPADPNELEEILGGMTASKYEDLATAQKEFVTSEFELGGSKERIAHAIENG